MNSRSDEVFELPTSKLRKRDKNSMQLIAEGMKKCRLFMCGEELSYSGFVFYQQEFYFVQAECG